MMDRGTHIQKDVTRMVHIIIGMIIQLEQGMGRLVKFASLQIKLSAVSRRLILSHSKFENVNNILRIKR